MKYSRKLSILMISACVLSITAAVSDAQSASQPSSRSTTAPQHGDANNRWQFATTDAERASKERTIRAIDKFWAAFSQQNKTINQQLQNGQRDAVARKLEKRLQTINPDLRCEIVVNDKDSYMLAVLPNSDATLRPLAAIVVKRAPELTTWSYSCYRSALLLDRVAAAYRQKHRVELPEFSVECQRNDLNTIDVTLTSPAFKQDDQMSDAKKAFTICALVLGEESLNKWAGVLRTRAATTKATVSKTSAESLEQLRTSFEKSQTEIENHLPAKPYFAQSVPDDRALLRLGKSGETPPRLSLVAIDGSLGKSLALDGFLSERFSKHNERFAYLQVTGAGDNAKLNKRAKLEESLDKQLRKAGVAAVVATGFGSPDKIYFDLAIADLPATLDLLRQFCTENNLPQTSCLRFYDRDWRNEWVGMYPQTPRPERSPELW